MSFKIAFIGAGSIGFTRKLLGDLLTVPEFASLEGGAVRHQRAQPRHDPPVGGAGTFRQRPGPGQTERHY